ncbi:MAG: TIGR03905 family TSCPD domain-containing protein [Gammaproteobacteria bacterium]|nr:TIGR03905 family TSCPD domain-containing protein [Gammaproteobacteria bacterium]
MVCSRLIEFDLDENNILHNVKFTGGCPGNLRAISKLIEGKKAEDIAEILKGNVCGQRSTSCADQLSIALLKAINS